MRSELREYRADYPGTRKYLVRMDYYSIAFEGTEPRDGEMLLLVGEQEVGIT